MFKCKYGEGVHYNIISFDSIDDIKAVFPEAEADELNFALFSTSGVHGLYHTLEEEEQRIKGVNEGGPVGVTVLIVHPRIVALRYGHIDNLSLEDIEYLKRLRYSSHKVIQKIGFN